MTTVAVRLPDEILSLLDGLIENGRYPNRTEAIKAGLAAIIDQHVREDIDRRIADAYSRFPETPSEIRAVHESTRALISEEPW